MKSSCVHYGIVGVSLLFAFALGGDIKFKDCGSHGAVIHKVDVSDCTQFPCLLKRGEYTTLTMAFTPTKNVSAVTARVSGYLFRYIRMTHQLPDNNGCHFAKCPLVRGTPNSFKISILTKFLFPRINMIIEWELKEKDTGKDVTCFRMEVKII